MPLRFVILLLALIAAQPALAERKAALLIGNALYSPPATALKNPPNDISAMQSMLEDAGFEVTVLQNADRAAMSEALASFEQTVVGADIGMIYYSGHGIEVNGDNFLIPVDAKLASDRDVKYETVLLDDLIHALAGVTKLKLVLLDACRDNPFLTSMKRLATRGIPTRGLSRIDSAESNMLIGYATAPGDVALDGEGATSPYATALARHLVTPGLEIEAALRAVAKDVFEATGGKQRPFKTGSLFETVMLGGGVAAGTSSALERDNPCRDAAAHWVAVSGRGDKTLLDEHVRLFGSCAFATLATREIAALSREVNILPETENKKASVAVGDDVPETECDRLAANPDDPMKLASLTGLYFGEVRKSDAVAACETAVSERPGSARLIYQLARTFYISGNYEQAVERYTQAANMQYPAAAKDLGLLYTLGFGVKKNEKKALELEKAAADGGHVIAMGALGLRYATGDKTVKRDFTQAVAWYRKAAEHGDVISMGRLGEMHLSGQGVEKDYSEAIGWFTRASDLRDTNSMIILGDMHFEGLGLEKNYEKAFNWYRRAVYGNNPAVLIKLAFMYDGGKWVSRNSEEAARHAEIALKRGAQTALDQMTKESAKWSQDFRIALQTRLKASGVYQGASDGNFGPETIRALQAIFNQEHL